MRWVILMVLLVSTTTYCSEDESNEVIIGSSAKPPINLDTNLRKALLKALVELENEEKETYDRTVRNDYVNIITHLDSKDKNIEKASASAVSFFSPTKPVNMTITVKKTTSKPKQIVVIQKSQGTQQRTIYENEDLNLSESPEQFIASASNSYSSSKIKSKEARKNREPSGGAQFNSLTSNVKTKKNKHEITTTTSKPTSSTEESEAPVESLQFFSAPLVAAFTVHQDDKGLPRSVVPIYNQLGLTTTSTQKPAVNIQQEQENLQREVLKQQKELEARQEEELRRKQKKLEEEIERLTKLKEEQERIIKEQRLSYEQKIFEQQKKLFEEQAKLYNKVQNVQPFIPITTPRSPPQFSLNQLGNHGNLRGNSATLVSIQPSVGFVQPTQTSLLPLNAQNLPVKNAVNFKTPFAQNFRQFSTSIVPSVQHQTSSNQILPSVNQQQNFVVPTGTHIQNSLSPLANPVQNFAIPANVGFFQNLPSTQKNQLFRQPSFLDQPALTVSQSLPFVSISNQPFRSTETTQQQHGTRSLRQETGTGNFLNTNRLNNQFVGNNFSTRNPFNLQTIQQQPPQFFKSNFGFVNPAFAQYNTLQYSVDQPSLNQRLNNLLYNSGLNQGRQQEDLNIVSKVLSLNHLGNSDLQYANSDADSRRLRAPVSWRVV